MGKYNWKQIQDFYNENKTWADVQEKFGMSSAAIDKAQKRGDFVSRSRSDAISLSQRKNPRTVTPETRLKISNARKKFLKENPDMVPYKLNHRHIKESYPEKYFKECFSDKFVSQYRVGLYELDFADLENRIDIEIDGEQHHVDPRIVEHDIVRNEFLIARGWSVLRIRWSIFTKSSIDERQFIVNEILSNRIPNHLSIVYYPTSILNLEHAENFEISTY